MKTKDRIKEEIGFYKLLMTIVFAIFSSITGWLFNNSNAAHLITAVLLLLVVVVCLVAIAFFLLEVNTKIKELDYE